ncbi:hypothetical protein H6P81_006336 [Aristolochia fimbriata]|uniref:Uncharacterized protein n=1 Tax=Aristolochia fimbriata TaxID=158543 RepID=A0AAV7F0I5_ARIFI|nr:hypothetical protein H6P81_006336 [Aristolochia fimbriata]
MQEPTAISSSSNFGRSLKGNAFDWFIELPKRVNRRWEQLESEFLARFYKTKLNGDAGRTHQPQRAPGVRRVGSPRDFQEPGDQAHNMEILIREKGEGKAPLTEADKKPKFVKEYKAPTKEALATNIAEPQKITATQNKGTGSDWKPNANRLTSTATRQKFTLKDRQAKTYPFPDSDVPGMLEQLLEKNLLQLPEAKRPEDVGKSSDPNYCKYHRLVGHPTEKCFVLKDRILELADAKVASSWNQDDNTAASHTIFVQPGSKDCTESQRTNRKSQEGKPEKKRGGRRHRRKSASAKSQVYQKKSKPITLADFFRRVPRRQPLTDGGHLFTPSGRAKREGKAPIESAGDIHTCLQNLSITNAVHDDLDLPIRSRQALIKFVAAKDDRHASRTIEDRRHDEPKIGLSPKDVERRTTFEPPQVKEAHSISISFKEARHAAGEMFHNRPLFALWSHQRPVDQPYTLDSGSAVNILPIQTLKNVGLVANHLKPVDDPRLQPRRTTSIGNNRLELQIGDMTSPRIVPCNRCPHLLQYAAREALFTHQQGRAFNPSSRSPKAVKGELAKPKKQTEEPILRYVPQSRRKKGESPFATCNREELAEKLKALKGAATIPLPKLNNRGILVEEKNPPELPKTRTQGFDPNAYRMMAKAGSGLSLEQLQEKSMKKPSAAGLFNPPNRHGLGYQKHKPVVISGKASVNQITTKRKATTSEETRTSAFDRIGIPEPRVSAFVRLGQEEDRNPNIPPEPSNERKSKVTKVWRKKGQAEDPKLNSTAPQATEKLSVFQRLGKPMEQPKRTVFQRLGAPTRIPATQRLGKVGGTSSKRIKSESSEVTPVVIYVSSKKKDSEEEEEVVAVHHISTDEGNDSTPEDDLGEAPAIFEEGGQATIDQLKKKRFRPELVPEIEKEVDKLLKADFIREVKYPSWIANIVPVKKKNGQIRVCVDFRDLNKACPKDDFPLPITELMVDATTGHEALSFMDGSSGYNQIRMDPKDEEKTAFRTPKGIFCYKVMPFGLKNAGATYQRAMQKIFDDFLHKFVECYADDVVVKTKSRGDHLRDLRSCLERLRRHQLKMNPLKCAFGVSSGKFLGFVVRHRGIEIDQTKIDAIQQMPEPKTLSELKSLQGHLAYIRRFISNLAGRCQPFSHLMKKDTPFEWDESCRRAFQNIKNYLMKPPVLMAPTSGKPLLLYIAAQEKSLGALLAQNDDQGKERPLYYLSRTMIPSNSSCPDQCFPDGWPNGPCCSLEVRDQFHPSKAIKGQGLANFLADHPIPAEWEVSQSLPDEEVFFIEVLPPWRMYFDGAARKNGAGAGVLFISPHEDLMPYSFILSHCCTNNEAEYQAIILGLGMAIDMGLSQLEIFGDSALVIKQIIGDFEVRKDELMPYQKEAQRLLQKISNVTLGHVPRASNSQADALAGIAASLAQFEARPEQIPICERWVVPTLEKFSEEEEINLVSVYAIEEEDWRQQFLDYLEHNKFPEGLKARVYVRRAAPKFCLFNNTLYRRSYDGILLRCVSKEEGQAILAEAHGGICGAHQAGPKLHLQVKQLGYYWPTMLRGRDRIGKTPHGMSITRQLHPSASQPFTSNGGPLAIQSLGMDIIEAAAYKEIKAATVVDFIRTQIVYRYGVPRYIMTDNGTPFRNKTMDNFCEKFGIRQRTSTAYNPAANGLAEAFNKTLCKILKKTVAGNKKDWHERLGEALWAYRITFRTPTESTPYSLVYGVEAVLPLEIQIPSLRVALREGLTEEENIQLRLQELESLDEKRLEAQQRLECYQARLTRAFNKKVKFRSFQKGDLVLAVRRPIMATSRDGGKFAPKWEGPFIVQEVYTNGAYKLVTPEGRRLPATNGKFLKKFYP